MLNSTTLEVAIGMALVYLLLSLFCTAINEVIAGILSSRAKNLERGIKSLFTDGLMTLENTGSDGKVTPAVSFAEAVYDHGLVQSLYRSTANEKPAGLFGVFGSSLPSYIPARVFSGALFDLLFTGNGSVPPAPAANVSTMLSLIKNLPESKGKEALQALVSQAGGDITKTKQAFESWYNDGMDRVSGWYKRRTQFALFLIGLIIAVSLNVNSITIGRALWVSPALRSYAVAAAEQYAADKSKNNATPNPDASKDLSVLQSLALPLGWDGSKQPLSASDWMILIAGWLLTAIAMTLGAPFWFDLLNRFMVVRSTIKPQEKSGVEGSKDAQTK